MERLTEKHVKKNGGYYMKCSEYCEREETMCIECERSDEIVDRLGEIEDILGDEYDLDRLRELVNQRMTLREDVTARMNLVGGIPMDRLRELVEADREGRCAIFPCKPSGVTIYQLRGKKHARGVGVSPDM